MNAVLRRAGLPCHPLESYRYFVGEGVEMLVRRALPEDRRDEGNVASFSAAMREEYGRSCLEATRLYPGVPELLDALTHRGLPLAILSNKPHGPTVEMVRALLGRWTFRAIAGAKPDVPKKPDPTAALQIASWLESLPADILYAGDTSTDMLTAGAAGMFAVGVLWGFRKADELEAAGARALVREPMEILTLLDPVV
jgi:phosphoglycolate phosphatase